MNQVSIGSDNGLLPIQHQAIILTNAGLLSIRPLGTNFSEILITIQNFSFMKMHLKISSVKWRPFCPEGYELTKSDWNKMAAVFAGHIFKYISLNMKSLVFWFQLMH